MRKSFDTGCSAQSRTNRAASRNKSNNSSNGGLLNTLFRQIVYSGIILAILIGINNIQSPSGKALNSYIENQFKYNIEYDWIVANITKTSEYIMSLLASVQG